MAVALHENGIPCRIYEARNAGFDVIYGGVTITPNGCRVLDALGVLERVAPRCYKIESMSYKNDRDETTERVDRGSREKFGYAAHRLYRKELFDELKAMLEERAVPVMYGTKFERVVSESASEGVIFEVSGGRRQRAALLVGADGIWSSVRKYIAPSCVPEYTGFAGILAHIPTSSVRWPSDNFEFPCTIQGKPGSLVFLPKVPDQSTLAVIRQFAFPARERAGWEALQADREQLFASFREGYEDWGATARSIIDQVCSRKEDIFLWPFHKVPKMDRWNSVTGRVLLVGDAAHALPPSSGQGANQALEDVYSLTLLLREVLPELETTAPHSTGLLTVALDFWNSWRHKRIDAVISMTNATNIRRLPEAERLRKTGNGKLNETLDPQQNEDWEKWMFQPDIDGEIAAWVQSHCRANATKGSKL